MESDMDSDMDSDLDLDRPRCCLLSPTLQGEHVMLEYLSWNSLDRCISA